MGSQSSQLRAIVAEELARPGADVEEILRFEHQRLPARRRVPAGRSGDGHSSSSAPVPAPADLVTTGPEDVPPALASAAAVSTSPAASGLLVVPPGWLQSTLPDYPIADFRVLNDHGYYHQIRSPQHGFPVVSAQQEQTILAALSSPLALQQDSTISPFAFMAALPTPAEVAEICLVPESIYGRVKLEMYPKPAQRRAVVRMWRSFPWKWSMEIDVKKFVSKQLNSRYLQSKNYKEKKMAEMWYTDVAARIAAGNPNAVGIVHAVAAANPDVPVVAAVVAHAAPSARVAVAAALASVVGASSSVAPVASLPAAAASSPDADASVPSTTSSTSAADSSLAASPAAGAPSPDGPDPSSPSASSSAAAPPTTPSPASEATPEEVA